MADDNQSGVTLSETDLNGWDREILDLLAEGRATPTLLKHQLTERGRDDVSRQYLNSRLTRLAEHGHVENLLDTGVYELREDPR